MQHDFEKSLWDIHRAGMDVLEFTHGKTFSDYQQDGLLRAEVERKLLTMGEAITRIHRQFPEQAEQIQHGREIVAFSDLSADEHHSLEDTTVWDIVERELPVVVAEVSVLLDEWHQG